MTTEQIKEQLKSYRFIKLERDQLAEALQELEDSYYSLGSPNLDGMPHGDSGPGNPTAKNALLHAQLGHAQLAELYRRKLAELTASLTEIENAIEGLAPRERTLIRLHYTQGLTWEQVCVAMSYSWRQVHRIHSDALEALRENAEETTKCD